jgi:hypothetical protein
MLNLKENLNKIYHLKFKIEFPSDFQIPYKIIFIRDFLFSAICLIRKYTNIQKNLFQTASEKGLASILFITKLAHSYY